MKLFKVYGLDPEGDYEGELLFLKKENAVLAKMEIDNQEDNLKYGIKQSIDEIETED